MNHKRILQLAANWRRRLNQLVVLALLLPLVAVAPARAPSPAGNVQPLLLQMAAEQPGAMVSVIVQKTARDGSVEALATRLGGAVTKDLSIINAFAAELPASAVPELAKTDGVRWVSLDAPVASSQTGTGGAADASSLDASADASASASANESGRKSTTWATANGTVVANGFRNLANILSPAGSNGTFGSGAGGVKGAFGGFLPEYAPGLTISKVEVVWRMYVSASLTSSETPKITAYVGGQPGTSVTVAPTALNGCVGISKVCTRIFDITTSRTWKWSDFRTLQILIDQSLVSSKKTVYYDAIGVRVTTGSGTDTSVPFVMSSSTETSVNTSVLSNVYNKVVKADQVWNATPYRQGSGVTIAVVDSGSFKTNAVGSRLLGEVNFNSAEHNTNDQYGHGTFVTSLVADDGTVSGGQYIGIAPKVNIIGVRISDDSGMSAESDVVNGLQWILDNKSAYNIRVVNLSLNAGQYQSYHTSPLDAACEILWFNGIVVVVSAGNNGTATLFPPANDPFVITVGATNDLNTVNLIDDSVASFSAYGADETGAAKPDLVAPGVNLIAYLPDNGSLTINVEHPANRVDNNYFRMSGTSTAAPLVSGAAALLLQDEPNLNPDQVKYRLMATANKSWPGYSAAKAGAGVLDVYAAVQGTTTQTANTGKYASAFLSTGTPPVSQLWGSAQWGSAQWGSAQWGSAQWGSAQWGSAQWGSDYWGQ